MKDVYTYMFPGVMYFWVFFVGQGPMQEILDERETKTLQRLLAGPVGELEFALSKMIRCFLLTTSIQGLLLLASAFIFGTGWGRPLPLVPVVLACALSVTGLLAFVYALARTKDQAYSISCVLVIVCGLLGGSFFPFEGMPPFLRAIGQFSPNRWGIQAVHTLAWGHPWTRVVEPIVLLCGIGLAGSVLALCLLRRRLRAGGGR